MPALTLQLRSHNEPLREPVAWFIPGSELGAWLTEILAWGVSHSRLSLLVVPRSLADLTPRGALVIPPPGERPRASPRCLAYGCEGGRLYLPVEARFEPRLAGGELARLISAAEIVFVWHPAAGLVGFEPAEKLSLAKLLSLPSPRAANWNLAEPGVALNARLVSLEPEESLSFQALLEQGRGDIGERSGQTGELPPAPHEPSAGPLSQLGRQMQKGWAQAALWLTSLAPHTGSVPNWINHLEDWAQRQLANANQISERLRQKEIERLLHLLQTNPDEGLKYALPLSGDAHRGLANPSNKLGPRDVRFDLRGIGGGGAADFWDLSAEYRQQMSRRYRDLAEREMRLGRHRRAAYIFAQLLGDLTSAAATLAAGGHHREAAVIYGERLHRPADAARCLEAGGLWSEAVQIYEELGEHEKAGDLYTRLEQLEPATAAYRQAVEKQRTSRDHLAAARLLETKLALPDEALTELSGAWPTTGQAASCLAESFRLLARLGRNAAAERRLVELRSRPLPEPQAALLAETLAGTAESYPNQAVKQVAADVTRVVVARWLPKATRGEQRRLLAAVNRLVPEDRLLSRDCQRYLREQEPKPIRPAQRAGGKRVPRMVHSFSIPFDVEWRTLASAGESYFAAGYTGGTLFVVRANWSGDQFRTAGPYLWKVAPAFRASPILLASDGRPSGWLAVHVVGGPALTGEQRFLAGDTFDDTVIAGPQAGIGRSTVAAVKTSGGMLWTLDFENSAYLNGDLVLSGRTAEGTLVSSRYVDSYANGLLEHDPLPIPLHARHDAVYIGRGTTLVRMGEADARESIELPREILALCGSAPHSRQRIAATFSQGGVVAWGPSDGGHMESFSGDLDQPLACFNSVGRLIVASAGACEVYDTQDKHLKLLATLSLTGPAPLAVLAPPRQDAFAIVTADGKVSVYEV